MRWTQKEKSVERKKWEKVFLPLRQMDSVRSPDDWEDSFIQMNRCTVKWISEQDPLNPKKDYFYYGRLSPQLLDDFSSQYDWHTCRIFGYI